MTDVLKAADFATRAHAGQVRTFTGEPYVTHPISVAIIIGALVEDYTDDMLKIALLHDVIEDTDETYESIRAVFGHDVAYGVYYVSKPEHTEGWETMTRAEKLKAYGEFIEDAPDDVHTVKLADIMHNVPDMALHAKTKKGLSYIAEKREFLKYLTKGDLGLYTKVVEMLDREEAKLLSK